MTDRLDLANAIAAAGIERKAAENIAGMIFDAIRENVATKQDLQIAVNDLRAEIQLAVKDLRAEMQLAVKDLRAEMRLIEHRLWTRVGSLVVVVAGLLFAALHYWPPHG
jgi:hypothetical protein